MSAKDTTSQVTSLTARQKLVRVVMVLLGLLPLSLLALFLVYIFTGLYYDTPNNVIRRITLSQDSRLLGVFNMNWLRLYALDEDKPRFIVYGDDMYPRGWSPDSKQLLVTHRRHLDLLYPIERKTKTLLQEWSGMAKFMWLDGTRLLYLPWRNEAVILDTTGQGMISLGASIAEIVGVDDTLMAWSTRISSVSGGEIHRLSLSTKAGRLLTQTDGMWQPERERHAGRNSSSTLAPLFRQVNEVGWSGVMKDGKVAFIHRRGDNEGALFVLTLLNMNGTTRRLHKVNARTSILGWTADQDRIYLLDSQNSLVTAVSPHDGSVHPVIDLKTRGRNWNGHLFSGRLVLTREPSRGQSVILICDQEGSVLHTSQRQTVTVTSISGRYQTKCGM